MRGRTNGTVRERFRFRFLVRGGFVKTHKNTAENSWLRFFSSGGFFGKIVHVHGPNRTGRTGVEAASFTHLRRSMHIPERDRENRFRERKRRNTV